jgi:diguanylate cyclase (GGDEF)-like protein
VAWVPWAADAGPAGRGRFDVVLLDLAPPHGDVPGTLRRLAQDEPQAAVLLLTSAEQAGACARVAEQAAAEYLIKECLTTRLLLQTVRRALERRRPPAAGGEALLDPLTGLPNRRGLLAQAARLWKTPGRLKKGLTLLVLDVDGLGWINATLGRAAGDQALVETAEVLRETFRGADLRARLGGDEFVLLAVGAPEPTAPILTARLAETLLAHNAQEGRSYQLALTVGLAHGEPECPDPFEEMLLRAEGRLREQKAARPRGEAVGV